MKKNSLTFIIPLRIDEFYHQYDRKSENWVEDDCSTLKISQILILLFTIFKLFLNNFLNHVSSL
jgi:hypothetical protein